MGKKKSDYWRDIVWSLRHPLDKHETVTEEVVTDPKTGITRRVDKPAVFVPIDFSNN